MVLLVVLESDDAILYGLPLVSVLGDGPAVDLLSHIFSPFSVP